MNILENTEDRLVIEDTHEDKKLALKIFIVFMLGMAIYLFVTELDGTIAAFPGVLAIAAYIALKLTKGGNTLTLDRKANQIHFVMDDGKEVTEFNRPFSELVRAFVSEKRSSSDSTSGTVKCPILVFEGGEEFKLRKHHSAGTQSRDIVDVITEFLEKS
ncbi:MAG: hypothetical protein AAF431_15120 [Pseudomonadota bacterium]